MPSRVAFGIAANVNGMKFGVSRYRFCGKTHRGVLVSFDYTMDELQVSVMLMSGFVIEPHIMPGFHVLVYLGTHWGWNWGPFHAAGLAFGVG